MIEHSPRPQRMAEGQLSSSLQSISQSVAAPHETPAVQPSSPQTTRHGNPSGHSTDAGHDAAVQSMTQTPSPSHAPGAGHVSASQTSGGPASVGLSQP